MKFTGQLASIVLPSGYKIPLDVANTAHPFKNKNKNTNNIEPLVEHLRTLEFALLYC